MSFVGFCWLLRRRRANQGANDGKFKESKVGEEGKDTADIANRSQLRLRVVISTTLTRSKGETGNEFAGGAARIDVIQGLMCGIRAGLHILIIPLPRSDINHPFKGQELPAAQRGSRHCLCRCAARRSSRRTCC